MENNFKKTHTIKDLSVSFILIAGGVGLYFISSGLGATLAISGLLCLLFWKDGYKINGRKGLLKKESKYLCKFCRESLLAYLNGENDELDIKHGNEGGSICLEVYYNKERNHAYAQVFDFSNYDYIPACEVTELEGTKAEKLVGML